MDAARSRVSSPFKSDCRNLAANGIRARALLQFRVVAHIMFDMTPAYRACCCAYCRLCSRIFIRKSSAASSTSRTAPTPRRHDSSSPVSSPWLASCAIFRCLLTLSAASFDSANSFSSTLSMSSNWEFPINHAFLPLSSRSVRFSCREDKCELAVYAFRNV